MTHAHTKAIFSHCSAVFHYKSTTGLLDGFYVKVIQNNLILKLAGYWCILQTMLAGKWYFS